MDSAVPIPPVPLIRPDDVAKTISDLDSLVQAVLAAMPQSKPWQRQLLTHLRQVDREIQILRLTISLGRESDEVRQAAATVNRSLRAANAYVSGGRADMGTKAAVRLAFELGQTMDAQFAS